MKYAKICEKNVLAKQMIFDMRLTTTTGNIVLVNFINHAGINHCEELKGIAYLQKFFISKLLPVKEKEEVLVNISYTEFEKFLKTCVEKGMNELPNFIERELTKHINAIGNRRHEEEEGEISTLFNEQI